MFGIEAAAHTPASTGIDRGTYTNGKSLVLDGGADYLSQTLGSPTDNNVCTISIWFKLSSLASNTDLFSAGTGGAATMQVRIRSDGKLRLVQNNGGVNIDLKSTAVFRDFHKFYHLVVAIDTDQGTAANRVRIYMNNVEITVFDTSTYPSSGLALIWNSADVHMLSRYSPSGTNWINGYLSKTDFIDGLQLTPSSFGHTSTDTGKWVPSDTSGLTFGTNGFSLDFNDDRASTPDTTSTIYDQSGNANNWTGNSLVAGSFTSDTPVDNFCTWNPLNEKGTAFTLGNTTAALASDNEWCSGSMIFDAADNTYFEVEVKALTTNGEIGITGVGQGNLLRQAHNAVLDDSETYTYINSGNDRLIGVSAAYGDAWLVNEFVGVHLNNGTLTFYNEGVSQGTSVTGLTGKFAPLIGQNGAGALTGLLLVDEADWSASRPTSAKQLTSSEHPEPTNWKPQDNANIVLYTGDGTAIGSGGLAVTGVGFTPDSTWIKNRDVAVSHAWTDIVRGVLKPLHTDGTFVESSHSEGLASFDADGFTVGSHAAYNSSGVDYWSLNILADNTSGSSNTDGSITSTVATDGVNFSIGTYTGTGANATVGHGLASAPDLIFVKERTNDVGSWYTYHSSNTAAPETDYLALDTTAATADLNTVWNDTAPTSSVFSIGTLDDVNASGDTYVFYAFVFGDVFAGGSYEGNNNADGTFIPSDELLMVVTKSIDSTSSWYIYDQIRSTFNEVDDQILADSAAAETTGSEEIDFVSNGVKLRSADAEHNAAETFIWFGVKKNGGQLAA